MAEYYLLHDTSRAVSGNPDVLDCSPYFERMLYDESQLARGYLHAFAKAAWALDRDDGSRALAASYRQVAERNPEFLLRELRQENGRLLHSWKTKPKALRSQLVGEGRS